MPTAPPEPPAIPRDLAHALHRRAQADRWSLGEPDFGAALSRSAASRYPTGLPPARELGQYLDSLHLEDLALACACARGSEAAWEHFVREFRPAVVAAARSVAPPDLALDLADSLYADLFGLEERDGVRRSLFDYFHGRSTLAGWLRAVLAQRVVDRVRAARRFAPLDEEALDRRLAPDPGPPDVDRPRFLTLARRALAAALAGLAPRDRLRLSLYYVQQLKLAAIGRVLGESEATASRKLERTRCALRAAVEQRLRDEHHLTDAQIVACFDYAATDPCFDLARTLPPPEVGADPG